MKKLCKVMLSSFAAMFSVEQANASSWLERFRVPIIDKLLRENQKTNSEYEVNKALMTSEKSKWWTGGISIYIDPSFSISEAQLIWSALREISNATDNGIRFFELYYHSSYQDYIHIIKDDGNGVGSPCWSNIGKQGGRQALSLGDGCLIKGIIMHEMLHAIGFQHEHQRPDRNNYITVYPENYYGTGEQWKVNFGIDNNAYPYEYYDYNSIMHYSKAGGAKPGTFVIATKTDASIGQRISLSTGDINALKHMINYNRQKDVERNCRLGYSNNLPEDGTKTLFAGVKVCD